MSILNLRLCLLGAFRLERNGVEISLPRRKLQALLAYLALHPEPHAREKLAALFWGDATDESARASLRNEISALRKLVHPDLLLPDRETIQLNPEVALWTDARAFSQIAYRVSQEPNSNVSSDMQFAIGDYADLLPDFYDDWILDARERLRAQQIETLLHLTQDARSQSDYARARDFARKVLDMDRANERAHQHLMFCQISGGDRAAALRQYEECVAALRDELAVEPSDETTALYQWIKQAQGGARSAAARLTNLPIPLTSLVGRQRETMEIKEFLHGTSPVTHHPSLVTLTGAGGSGKTRLAIQVGTDLVDAYRDGVWWVELAALNDPTLVPQAVAQALGIFLQPNEALTTTLLNALRERELLLLLDNCEHLVDACARLAEQLLTHCSALQILATSREALNVPGEVTWLVPLLGVPTEDGGRRTTDGESDSRIVGEMAKLAMNFESVRLFVERAGGAQRAFQLTDANVPMVIEICRRLDGIPLALELAAARVKTLSVEQIAARLSDRFGLLTTGARTVMPRQQTLRALIDWSYDLLTEEERQVFAALAVFAGGWALDAAEFVCAEVCASARVFDFNSALVEKSLVVVDTLASPSRYRMLETIREYARLKLEMLPTRETLSQQHLKFFSAQVEAAQPALIRRVVNDQVRALFDELDNFRAALAFAKQSVQPTEFARLFGALVPLWIEHGQVGEIEVWENLLSQMVNAEIPASVFARALVRAAQCKQLSGDLDRSDTLAHQALELYRAASDAEGSAVVLALLGMIHYERGDLDMAEQFHLAAQDALALLARHSLHAAVKVGLALVAWSRQDILRAHTLLTEALEIATQDKDIFGQVRARVNLAGLANSQRDWARALTHIQAAMPFFESGHFWSLYISILQEHGTALSGLEQFDVAAEILRRAVTESATTGMYRRLSILFERLAWIAAHTNHAERAVRLLAAAEHTRAQKRQPRGYSYQADYDATLAAARATLDAATFETAWAKGQSLSQAEAITLALQTEQ